MLPGSEPSRRGEKPATNGLSYGTVLYHTYLKLTTDHHLHIVNKVKISLLQAVEVPRVARG
jgi:hypothetical protein